LVNASISVEASRVWIELLYSRHFGNQLQRVCFEQRESSHFAVMHCSNGNVLREPIDLPKMEEIKKQAERDWSELMIRHDVGGSAVVNAFSVEDSDEASLEHRLQMRFQQLESSSYRVLGNVCKSYCDILKDLLALGKTFGIDARMSDFVKEDTEYAAAWKQEVEKWDRSNLDLFGKILQDRHFPFRTTFSFRRLHLVRCLCID
jgi:hypothetical protein